MPTLSYIQISGSPHEAGLAFGRFGADMVRKHLIVSKSWIKVMQWRGSSKTSEMASLVRVRFPRIWSELEGLALGLNLPFEDVFLWNARGDLWAMSPDGCTTVQLPGNVEQRLTHNEDGDPSFSGHCAIAECVIDGSPRFASFLYPGSLPGHTFAVTDSGLAMTVNNLRLLQAEVGVPRMVLTRALLDAISLTDALNIIRDTPRSGGFHLTLAHKDSKEISSVEFGAGFCSVRTIDRPALHSNHAIHKNLSDLPQIITGSSGNRQIRGEEMIANATDATLDPLSILYDRKNTKFPIYRDKADDSDEENTMATADITVRADSIEWQIYESSEHTPRFWMKNGRQASAQK
jgi:predicted choloylglycine hydrolase